MKQQEKRIAAFIESVDSNLPGDGQSVLLSSELELQGEGMSTNGNQCNNSSVACSGRNIECTNHGMNCLGSTNVGTSPCQNLEDASNQSLDCKKP